MSEDLVACPIENCDREWDAVEAAKDANFECPGCLNGWPEFHEAVDVQPDPEDVQIDYPIDGPGGVRT